ncbi:MAG: hypothetical protein HOO90_03175 [Methylotenera sp.]|nr:hypothetical protein [Methylotenera sp.]
MDDISAIEHSTKRLNEDAKKNIFEDDQYLNALFAIDEKTHIIVDRITTHYINIDNMSLELEERIANAVFLHYRQQFLVYNTLIQHLAPFQPSTLPMMLVRAINNATQMIKWRYYNYQSAPANVWLQLAKLYLIAEKNAILETYVRTYEDQEITTIASAYIQACMLGSLESLSFHRKQIELVSQMLASWTPKILIQKIYDEHKHLFYVDTTSDAPAKRIRNFKPTDNCRYWCFDSVNLKVELCLSLLEYNIAPKQQEMKDFITNKYALATLEILRSEWSRGEYKRQRRAVDRVKTSKYASTTFGFENTCYHIQQHENMRIQRVGKSYQGNKSFDERLATHSIGKTSTEPNIIYLDLGAGQSKIIDESSQGIGMYTSKPANEVSLGMLVGISFSDQKDTTKIGVIRSIKPVIGNELHLGIELLSTTAFCAEARNIQQNSNQSKKADFSAAASSSTASNIGRTAKDPLKFSSETASFTCLYLPKEFTVTKQESLIVPRLHYIKNAAYNVNISGKNMQVKFDEALEYHDNWLRVTYSQILENQLAA